MVRGLTLDQAVKKMRGEPNTKVTLSIFRKAETRTFPVTLVREESASRACAPSWSSRAMHGCVSIFQDRTVEDFARKLDELYKQDPNIRASCWICATTRAACSRARWRSRRPSPPDAVVVSTNGQIGDSKATFKASPEFYLRRGGTDPLKRLPDAVKKVPLVVLVNEGPLRPARSSPVRCRTTSAPS